MTPDDEDPWWVEHGFAPPEQAESAYQIKAERDAETRPEN